MLVNYLKIALRKLTRHKTFSAINLLGLTLGTICCLYMVLYVQHHYGYDQHHEDVDQIVRVRTDVSLGGTQDWMQMATCSPPIVEAIQADFPEVELAARACPPIGVEQQLIRIGEQSFYETPGYYVDSTFFEILNYNFQAGDPASALNEPFSVVISDRLAKKYFGDEAAVGQIMEIGDWGDADPFTVTGVIDYSNGTTHLESDIFLSMNAGDLGQFVRNNDSWAGNNFLYGYLKLAPGTNREKLAAKLPGFIQRRGGDQLKEAEMEKVLHLQPILDIHTNVDYSADVGSNASPVFLRLLLLIAIFIQLVACINFMNLTTARATRSSREVGVRKVVGAPRRSIFSQFLVESLLLSVMSVGLAVPLIHLLLPTLNELTGISIALDFTPANWLLLSGIALVTGLLAGSYPALYLSSFKPLALFNQWNTKQSKVSWLRQGLVVGQMVVASILVIAAFIIHTQVSYMLNKDLGFEKTQKVIFDLQGAQEEHDLAAFHDGLRRLSEVKNVAAMANTPVQYLLRDMALYKDGQSMQEAQIVFRNFVSEEYLDVLKIELLAGRMVGLDDISEDEFKSRIVVNESVLEQYQIPVDEAVGTVLRSEFSGMSFELTIIGVIEDIMNQKLTDEIRPFALFPAAPENLSYAIADISSSDYEQFLGKAKQHWEATLPGLPFDYSFLDKDIAQLYETEQTLTSVIGTFTLIAILIACLGLFGLSVYAAEQRRKEVGIRKVLGASVQSLVGLLSKEFLILVGIALILASPIAYLIMREWLTNFAYQTPLHWWIFALSGVMTLVIAFLTVSFQAIRAAIANPIGALRDE
ncbi:MAG: ABC transporter permease [Bacteroidota bacterium]